LNPILHGLFLHPTHGGVYLLPPCVTVSRRACRTKIFGRCWWSEPNFFNYKLGWWRHPSSWWRHVFSEKTNFFFCSGVLPIQGI